MKWLTGLVSRGEEWVGEAEQEKEQEDRMAIVDDAAVLLSSCAGTSTGPLMRTFEFPTDGEPIVIYLRDASILSQDHTSVGLQTWGSCCILANRMARHPEEYGLQKESLSSKDGRIDSTNASSSPLRVLELGAGTGLLSMVVAKMLAPTAEVFATDFHPAVLDNLQANVSGNFTGPPEELVQCVPQVLPLDWQSFHAMRSAQDNGSRTSLDSPFNQTFDIIIGADIIYEPTHAHWIKSTVEMTLRKPSGVCRHVPGGCFHLIMPARPTHDEETASVPAAFPSADSIRQTRQSGGTTDLQLGIVSMDELDRVAGTGRSDEVHYILYRIEWV
ncbi:hypothetical protein FRB99_001367 [Tulasnella sp. 403]|nr:hypothetical protein FRB99_001367 [Tulasnella sp. 403]